MKKETTIIHAGRDPEAFHGAVNPPVYRTSTVICQTMDDWNNQQRRQASSAEPDLFYGRHGTPTTQALRKAVAELEGGYKSFVYPSGVSACATALLAFAAAGDHILLPDNVYGPVRHLASGLLKRYGVEAEFYDPKTGNQIEALFRPNTRLVYIEAPGSMTFEMADVPALAAVAHAHGAVVVMDNTWATPLYFQPFTKGVDVSIQAATKYIVGHSDVMMGMVISNESCYARLKETTHEMGLIASPDDCYLALRGLRTLALRLERHQKTGLQLANFLAQQPEVRRVMHPARPDDPGYALWKRDFLGASGLFAFEFAPEFQPWRTPFVDSLTLFAIGGSWGGFESLALPMNPVRDLTGVQPEGGIVRLHAGLENVDDLLADLDRVFTQLRNT